jgi:hypothetical protein
MSLRHFVPADVEAASVAELCQDCASLRHLCPTHLPSPPARWHPLDVPIPDRTRQLLEGMSDYGD